MLTLSTHVSGFTLHTVILFTLSKHMLGSKCFRIHSPYSYLVYTLQAHVRFKIFSGDHFFMLTLSTHVSGFTLHTVILFTLSKHMLGSKCFRIHSPYSYLVYNLQAHVRFKIFSGDHFFMLTLSTHVSGLFCLHSPSTC